MLQAAAGAAPASAVSRDEILARAWAPDEFPTERTVDNFILRLRKLVERDPANPRTIRSIRGVGYQLGEPDPMTETLLTAAMNRRNTGRPPVWMMRQAGRYHSHYQIAEAVQRFHRAVQGAGAGGGDGAGPDP